MMAFVPGEPPGMETCILPLLSLDVCEAMPFSWHSPLWLHSHGLPIRHGGFSGIAVVE